ncbi:hypothetical protein ACS0TY_009855 [Phlomoides rotata]
MGRSPCCDKVGLKKGPWTPEEDQKLLAYIQEHGHGSWRALPPKAGLQRCGKSCRLRWTNYLRPDIKRGKFSSQEEQTIIQLHALLGNRTDNEIKNYWNTHLKKRLVKNGIDPTTHKPKNHALGSSQPKYLANLSHMAQWESARLEAEARIVRESKLVSSSYHSHLLTNSIVAAPPPSRLPCLDILKVWQGTWARPRKDLITRQPFFTSNGTLESPTSILNFSDNIGAIPTVGLIQENAYVADHNKYYVGSPGACSMGKGGESYQEEQVKGIMENSMQLHDHHHITDPTTSAYVADHSLKFPSFMEGFTDLPPSTIACANADNVVFEDNKMNYWSNILNVVNSPMGSPAF